MLLTRRRTPLALWLVLLLTAAIVAPYPHVPRTAQAQSANAVSPAADIFLGFASDCAGLGYPTYAPCRRGGIADSGFTTVLPGTRPADTSLLTLNSALGGTLSITTTAGDIFGSATSSNQDNALALPIAHGGAPFSIGTRLRGPLALNGAYQGGGIVLGLNADRYIKLVMAFNNGAGPRGIQFAIEDAPSFNGNPGSSNPTIPLEAITSTLDLFLTADPLTRRVTALYRLNSNDPADVQQIGSPVQWSNDYFGGVLHGGLLTTNNGTSPTRFDFDWFKLGPAVYAGGERGVSFVGPDKLIDQAATDALLPNSQFGRPTTLAFAPDGRLYVGSYWGTIFAYTFGPDGTPTAVQRYDQIARRANRTCPNQNDPPPLTCPLDERVSGRQLLGLSIAPSSTAERVVLYVTHSDPRWAQSPTSPAAKAIDTYSGALSRVVIERGVVTADSDLVTGMPRSREYHSINGLSSGPEGWLYIGIGGHTNAGAGDGPFFSFLPEYYLSAAVVRVQPEQLVAAPIDVRAVASSSALAAYAGRFELYSTGFRNPYDLHWHSNGKLYVNVNASNAGLGNTPDAGEDCPNGQASDLVPNPPDTLEWARPQSYHGHPNPSRGECIWESGQYPSANPPYNRAPEASYVPEVYAFKGSKSVNGIAEYTANLFDGALRGNLIVAAYAGDHAVRRLVLGSDGTRVVADTILTQALRTPLDVTVGADGTIYVANFGGAGDTAGIYTLRPNVLPANASCPAPGSDPARTDNDGDRFIDQDELDNGIDRCSPASLPTDFDGDRLSDLHDPDNDNDGVANNRDQLQYDLDNGSSTTLPLLLDFFDETRGVQKTGFLGVQLPDDAGATLRDNNGHGWGLYQGGQRLGANGVSGALSIQATRGSNAGTTNTQDNALQIGFDASERFSMTTEIGSPFISLTQPPTTTEEAGLFLGQNKDTYVKLVARRTATGTMRVMLAAESDATYRNGWGQIVTPTLSLPFSGTLRLALIGNRKEGYLAARYSVQPPELNAPPTPWQTIGVLRRAAFPALDALLVAPRCPANRADGCLAAGGLLTQGDNDAHGFYDFAITPYPQAPQALDASGFSAQRASAPSTAVGLRWLADGQVDLGRFELFRANSNSFGAASRIATVQAQGDPLLSSSYSYTDTNAPQNPVYYWLRALDSSGRPGITLTAVLNNKANQSITFAALADRVYGEAPFTLTATASSGLPVAYSASGGCTVAGNRLQLIKAGSCTVTAEQTGDAGTNPAPSVERTFVVARAVASVAVADKSVTYDGATHAMTGTTTPGGLRLTMRYEGIDGTSYGPLAIPPRNPGSYRVTATVDEDNYTGEGEGTLLIARREQNISFTPLVDVRLDEGPLPLRVRASSGLPVALGTSGPCFIADDKLLLLKVGTCSVTAQQAGNTIYDAAPTVTQRFIISAAANGAEGSTVYIPLMRVP